MMPAQSETPPRRIGWYHGWNVVALCVLCQFMSYGLTVNSFSLFLKDWTAEFHAPASSFTLALLYFSIIAALTSPLAGSLAGRLPARLLLGSGLLAIAVVHAVIGFASARWQILLVYGTLLPLGLPLCTNILGQALVSRWFVKRVGLAMGVVAAGGTLGSVIVPPVLAKLLPMIGWRWTWWLWAVLIVGVTVPLSLLIARDRPGPRDGRDYLGAKPPRPAAPALPAREILLRRNFWIILAAFLPTQFAYQTVSINMAPLLASHGFGAATAAGLLSILGVSAICSKFIFGLAVDKFGNRLSLTLACLAPALGSFVLAEGGPDIAFIISGTVLVGLGMAMWTLVAAATVAEFGTDSFGKAYGILLAFSPASLLVPTIVARSQEAIGSYAPGLLGLSALAFAGAITSGMFWRANAALSGSPRTAGPHHQR
jgi:MFS family permease